MNGSEGDKNPLEFENSMPLDENYFRLGSEFHPDVEQIVSKDERKKRVRAQM